MYIGIHSFCNDTHNWAQVYPVSTDHKAVVSTTWLKSTCGKLIWLDVI